MAPHLNGRIAVLKTCWSEGRAHPASTAPHGVAMIVLPGADSIISEGRYVIEDMDAWSALLITLIAASSAAIATGTYVVVSGRTPRVPWCPTQAQARTRARAQGAGLVLIGGVLLLSALAVAFGSHSSVRAYWILEVWVA